MNPGGREPGGRAALLNLWLAQGFGSGRLRPGPGTWGSLVGLGLSFALGTTGRTWPWIVVCAAGPLAAIPSCGAAARFLREEDPGSVVLDEIVAMPWVFLGLRLSGSAVLDGPHGWIWWLAGFGAFRVFDIWKPGPIGRLQRWPGGRGIVADDLAAAVAAAAVLEVIRRALAPAIA